MADVKVISKELVIEVQFYQGEAPDTRHPFNTLVIRPHGATIRIEADADRPLLRNVVLSGHRVLRDGLGDIHDITFWPGEMPTWLSIIVGEAKELAR